MDSKGHVVYVPMVSTRKVDGHFCLKFLLLGPSYSIYAVSPINTLIRVSAINAIFEFNKPSRIVYPPGHYSRLPASVRRSANRPWNCMCERPTLGLFIRILRRLVDGGELASDAAGEETIARTTRRSRKRVRECTLNALWDSSTIYSVGSMWVQ